MGLFTDSTQRELNSFAAKIYEDVLDVSNYMDNHGTPLDGNLRYRLQLLEKNVEEFCRMAKRSQSTHDKVKWQGQMTFIPGVLYAILAIVEDIRANTGYPFSKLS